MKGVLGLRTVASALRSARPALLLLLPGLSGCQQEPILASVRSLEQSGKAVFVCLAAPGTPPTAALPLSTCTRQQTSSTVEFGLTEDGQTTLPHLYALVTQTTRGEVAVVDLTSVEDSVLDLNPEVPGANFIPVGANPVDIVATAGGTAAFVGVAEPGREGIFALPADKLRTCLDCKPTALSGFPSCSLPSAPGAMMLMTDAAKDGVSRAGCFGDYGPLPPAGPNGDLSLEGEGRQKLVVAMPDLGGIAVFDAQRILDGGWKSEPSPGGAPDVYGAGAFAPCEPEIWLPIPIEQPPSQPVVDPDQGPACTVPQKAEPSAVTAENSRPSAFAFTDGRLYVADLNSPLIQVLSMETPCEPSFNPPLVATSAEDPSRLVTTSKLGVTLKPTADLKRYLYAVDADEGSVMVFDVSDDKTSRFPLRRPGAEWNPFQPPDRIRFAAPIRDVLMIDRDAPQTVPATGEAPEGVRCDPDPSLALCTAVAPTCDPATLYRTGSDYATGAGPLRLRGQFGMLMLTTGQLVTIDVDDLDAKCRVPSDSFSFLGCAPTGTDPMSQAPIFSADLASSNEVSCNVVVPHATRSSKYLISNGVAGNNEPGVQAFPILYDRTGTPLTEKEGETLPMMRATLPPDGQVTGSVPINDGDLNVDDPDDHLALTVGTSRRTIDASTGFIVENGEERKNTLVMNMEDPRVHTSEQQWFVTFEGALPGFGSRRAMLSALMSSQSGGTGLEVTDADSRFCSRGVQSRQMVKEKLLPALAAPIKEQLIAGGMDPAAAQIEAEQQAEPVAYAQAADTADLVQITSELPEQDNAYWGTAQGCNYLDCKAIFGTAGTPSTARDLAIEEAYDDRLVLLDPVGMASGGVPVSSDLVRCCFPTEVPFLVRPRSQWTVIGGALGFLHHVIADPATGVCRDSCDPLVKRMNGRVPAVTQSLPKVSDGDPAAFINPLFRFAITEAGTLSRDLQFRFTTRGAFAPLRVDLRNSLNTQPTSMSFLSPFGEIVVTDGLLEGIYMVSLSSFAVRRQIF